MDFRERTDLTTFDDDVEIGLLLREAAGTVALEEWLPERLFYRAVYLGRAYELHNLGSLDVLGPLNHAQAGGLSEEIEFVAALVPGDDALSTALARINRLAAACARSGGRKLLEVDLP